MLQLPLNVQLNDNANFDNFLSGDNLQLVEKLTKLTATSAEFIFVWGSAESGKTHLAQALCNHFNQQAWSAAYLPLANRDLSAEILDGMSVMELVCIDDLASVEKDKAWEEGLFDLYNNLKLEQKNLVVFSASPPAKSSIKLADLKSRLSAMEIYKIEPLNDEQKITLLQKRAANRGMDVPADVAKFILSRQSRSVSDLIDILDQIDHSSMVLQRKVTIPLIKEILDL
ncbi:DnaA regulatory inactivator Hda [Aliikangiella coralliicola]|uniref:DnaA regulatory inactivator Hda n=1 Tax=Aliikangiella coralliicola TaxID=2592383 RepID=A0A545U501_9GAMM|nr:DnaA regulatory inactivator Hda [Aliikangiella coralliicola]TQV84532.1 DnaA regulatory inactivator Hda [Aliikangiella coralliicola]